MVVEVAVKVVVEEVAVKVVVEGVDSVESDGLHLISQTMLQGLNREAGCRCTIRWDF